MLNIRLLSVLPYKWYEQPPIHLVHKIRPLVLPFLFLLQVEAFINLSQYIIECPTFEQTEIEELIEWKVNTLKLFQHHFLGYCTFVSKGLQSLIRAEVLRWIFVRNAVKKNNFHRVFLTSFCGESRWIIYYFLSILTKKNSHSRGLNF